MYTRLSIQLGSNLLGIINIILVDIRFLNLFNK